MSSRPASRKGHKEDEHTQLQGGRVQPDDGSRQPLGPAVVPGDAITKVEMSLGRKSRKRGALIGALAGAAVGSIAVLATPDTTCDTGDLFACLGGPTQGEAALIVGVMGAAAGALVGSLIPPGERWQAAAARPRVSVAPRHKGVQISLSFGF
jgi:hypothetical protein